MTAPVWMALPPEIHSAQLSSGPGPAGLLAAAAAWSSLSTTYASTADELSATLAAAQAGAWEGPTAEQYAAAHAPYLAWLMQASADSAASAARHETAATAYTAALAAMPTLPELAANHTIHGVLVATNFLGINTIPIAVNEADYARMWVQAATTMSTYQAVSTMAVATTPQTDPAPVILHADSADDEDDGDGGIVDNDGGNPYQLSWWINRFLEIFQTIGRDLEEFPENPSAALTQLWQDIGLLIADEFGHAIEAFQAFAPQIAVLTLALPVAAATGLVGLVGLTSIQPEPAPNLPATAALPAGPKTPALAAGPPASAPAAASAPTPTPTSATAPAPASMSATGTPPPTGGVEGAAYPYLIGGPPAGFGSGATAGAQRKAPEPDSAAAAAAAAASAREQRRARRRRKAGLQDHYRGYEVMDMEPDVESAPEHPAAPATSSVASDRGAGPLGFTGTASKGSAEATGLTTLAGDDFGGGPSLPLLPGSWEGD
ncbi:PPE family protein [Mycobacterium sp. HNNTM2301]|uniref:PPE family protein n=1 Tax=Mycobacterium hainanense TaxID=3289775 RepID=UPI0035A61285